MKLSEYIENSRGIGILSRSDSDGDVNGAVCARPHVSGIDTIGYIMRDRLSRANLQENRRAHFLFVEEGSKSNGIRPQLDKIFETDDVKQAQRFSRRKGLADDQENRHLVTFKVRKALRLVGGDEISLQ